ncbi:MAG: hypothetical protein WC621_02115 [Patescibacteria group bacterium]
MAYANTVSKQNQKSSLPNSQSATTHPVGFKPWWVFLFVGLLAIGFYWPRMFVKAAVSPNPCTTNLDCEITWTISTQDPEGDPVRASISASPATYYFYAPNCNITGGSTLGTVNVGICDTGNTSATGALTVKGYYKFSAAGTYTLSITSCDNAQHCTSDSNTQVVVSPPPGRVNLTSYPANPTNSTSANFVWDPATNATSYGTFLDSGSYQTLTTTWRSFSGLTAGSHTFTVCGLNLGVSGPCTHYPWLVDNIAPICTASLGGTNGTVASAVCSDTGGAGCVSNPPNQTVTGSGAYTFNVTDNAGNPGSCAVTAYVHYDYSAWGVCGSFGAWNQSTYTRTGAQSRTITRTYYNTTSPADTQTLSQSCGETDNASPTVNSFDVQPRTTNGSVTITFAGSDTGGTVNSGVNHYEVWRAPDSGGAPGVWSAIKNPATSGYIDPPTQGTYWYGIHVVDNSGRYGTESAPIKVIIDLIQPACGSWSPSSSPWKASGTQSFILSGSTDLGGSGIATSGGSCTTGSTNGSTCNVGISDNAGNSTTCTSPPNNVDTTGPAISTLTAVPASWTTGSVTISGSLSDSQSGLLGYYSRCTSSAAYTFTASTGNITFICSNQAVGSGGQTASAYGVDNVSNAGASGSVSYYIDTTVPSQVTLTVTPAFTNNSFSLSWTNAVDNESGIKHYELWRAPDSGGTPGTWSLVSNVGTATSATDNPTTGIYWYGVHAVNNVNLYSTESSAQKGTKDTTAPNQASCSPGSGSYSPSVTVNCSAGADQGSPQTSVATRHTVNGTNPTCASANFVNSTTYYSDTTVKIITCDSAGNASSLKTYNYNISGTNPISFSFTPTSSSGWKAAVTSVTLGVSSANGITSARYNWDNAAGPSTGTVYTNGAVISSPVGSHYLYTWAQDSVNQTNTAGPIGLYQYDNQGPSTPSLSAAPVSWTTGSVTISGSMSDSQSGLLGYYSRCTTSAAYTFTPSTTGNITFICNNQAVGSGGQTASAYGVDNVNNNGASGLVSYYIDTTPPSQVTLTVTPAFTNNSFSLSWTNAVDNESGLARYEIWRAPDSSGAPGVWLIINNNATSPSLDTPASGGKYYYGIHAVNNVNLYSTENPSQPWGVKDITPPTCTASLGGTNGTVASAVCSDTGGAGCTGNPSNQTVTGSGAYTFNVTDNAGNPGSCAVTAYVHYDYSAWGVCGSFGAWNQSTYTRTGAQNRTITRTYYNTTSPADTQTLSQSCGETDNANPTVNSFDVQPRTTNGSVTITFAGSDTGGAVNSGVNHYEVWRAPDNGGSPGSWSVIINPATTGVSNNPAGGIYWYGIHVVDNSGRYGTESGAIKVVNDTTGVQFPNKYIFTKSLTTGQLEWVSGTGITNLLRPSFKATINSLAGIQNCLVYLDNQLMQTFGQVTQFQVDNTTKLLANGSHIVRLACTDNANNITDDSSWTFTVNNKEPAKPNLR